MTRPIWTLEAVLHLSSSSLWLKHQVLSLSRSRVGLRLHLRNWSIQCAHYVDVTVIIMQLLGIWYSVHYNTSGDENHLCGASLHESQVFFENTQAWPNYNSMSVSYMSIARPEKLQQERKYHRLLVVQWCTNYNSVVYMLAMTIMYLYLSQGTSFHAVSHLHAKL